MMHVYARDAPDFRWMASPAIDKRGNIGIGYSFGAARPIRRPALRGAHAGRSARAAHAARSRAGRRRSGANLNHALAGLHADRDRSRRRLHHLVCWRLHQEGRGELLDAHRRLSIAWMFMMMKHLSIRLKADTTLVTDLLSHLLAARRPRRNSSSSTMRCAALGGRDRVEAAKTLTIEGEGVNYNLGQDMKPEAATQQFAISNYKRQIDIANGRQRVEQTRTPKFAFFQGPQPQTQILGLDGAIAFNVNAQGQPARARRAGRNRSASRPLSPSAEAAALDAGSEDHRRQRAHRRRGAAGRHHHRRRSGADDDDRRGGRAVVDLVEGLSPEPRRRHDDDDVRRVPGRERPASAGAVHRQGGRLHDVGNSRHASRRSMARSAISRAPAAVAAEAGTRRRRTNVTAEPIGKGIWFLAGGSRITACSSSSRIT